MICPVITADGKKRIRPEFKVLKIEEAFDSWQIGSNHRLSESDQCFRAVSAGNAGCF